MSTTSAEVSPSPSPVAPNAPKFGTLVPNRIFVGGISASTTEEELHDLFSSYGNVKATKIISDRAGVSKGYGFVTFETEEEARRIQKEADNIVLKDRKLNIAPAIKKQPFTRVYDSTQMASSNGTILYHNGIPYTYQNGMAFFTTPENICQFSPAQATYPLIYPQPIYMPQQQFQYQTAAPSQWTSAQWRWSPTSTSLPTQYVYTPLSTAPVATAGSNSPATELYQYGSPVSSHLPPPISANTTHSSVAQNNPHLELAESSTVETSCTEVKKPYIKKNGTGGNGNYSSPRKTYSATSIVRSVRARGTNSMTTGAGDSSNVRTPHPFHQPQLVAKAVNGVTIMAYPTPVIVSSPGAVSQFARDHSIGDRDAVSVMPMTEIGVMHQYPHSAHPMTPPPTPLTPMPIDVGPTTQ